MEQGIVSEKGINDMPRGWRLKNRWNKIVYVRWSSMLNRVYKNEYYIDTTIQLEMHWLSYFDEHIKEIDGYNEEKFLNGELELDKDIKSNGKNHEYSIKNCVFVSRTENIKQANKTRYYKTGIDHPLSIRIAQYDKQENLLQVWNGSHEIKRELGISNSKIIACCKFWEINCNKEEWFKTHKKYPCKTCGGYIFKYFKEDDEID